MAKLMEPETGEEDSTLPTDPMLAHRINPFPDLPQHSREQGDLSRVGTFCKGG